MSRSVKKNPVCKCGRSGKVGKKLANRRVRRALVDLPRKSKAYKKIYQSYDICDYIVRWDKRDALVDYYYSRRADYWQSRYTEEEFINYWAKACMRK